MQGRGDMINSPWVRNVIKIENGSHSAAGITKKEKNAGNRKMPLKKRAPTNHAKVLCLISETRIRWLTMPATKVLRASMHFSHLHSTLHSQM